MVAPAIRTAAACCLAGATLAVAPVARGAVRSHIIGGQPGGIPQLVTVDFTDASGGGHGCSGTIVALNVVLTAAHCAGGTLSSYQVQNGRGLNASVTRVVIEPGFDPTANYVNDAALLVLSAPTWIAPVALDPAELAPGASVVIQGWGNTSATGGAGISAMTASTTLIDDATCEEADPTLAPSQMCALDPDHATIAPGDSGGPLLVETAAGVEQAGVNDEAFDATGDWPSVFTRVDQFYAWAQGVISTAVPVPVPVGFSRAERRSSTRTAARRGGHR